MLYETALSAGALCGPSGQQKQMLPPLCNKIRQNRSRLPRLHSYHRRTNLVQEFVNM